jgi:member of the syntaxin family of t-SNAREs
VEEVGGEVDDMREELQKSLLLSASKPRRGANGAGIGLGIGTGTAGEAAYGGAGQGDEEALNGDSYAEFEHQQQLRMMSEQDSQLEGVFQTVGNLRQQADTMGRELEEQAEMLEVVDGLADRVGGRLQTGLKKVGTIVKKNEDGLSSCCIGLLILVLVILLILVLVI